MEQSEAHQTTSSHTIINLPALVSVALGWLRRRADERTFSKSNGASRMPDDQKKLLGFYVGSRDWKPI
jgi:hypothetical protein